MTNGTMVSSVLQGGHRSRFEPGPGDCGADAGDLDTIAMPVAEATPSACSQSLMLTAKIAVVICAVEFLTLVLATILPFWPEGIGEAAAHTVLLAVIVGPLIMHWGIRPFVLERREACAELAAANEKLCRGISERMQVEKELRAREYELEAQLEEISYMKGLMEKQAADAVALAEDLSNQKQVVEASERRNEYLANHDMLTGLPNRRSFERQLSQLKALANARNGAVTLIFVDLDNFKAVNDTLGHQRGDELLMQVAAQLRNSTREADLIARLGGDEFAVVSTQFGHSRDAELRSLAERIRQSLLIPVAAGDRFIPVSATLGIATYPADAADERKLLQCADRAMYAAKAGGRNRVVFHHDLESLRAVS